MQRFRLRHLRAWLSSRWARPVPVRDWLRGGRYGTEGQQMKIYRGSKEPEKPTKERLTDALTAAGAPQTMIEQAQRGYYDDYESELATPIHQLVRDCLAIGLRSVAERASGGEFDGTRAEADAWFKREGAGSLRGHAMSWAEIQHLAVPVDAPLRKAPFAYSFRFSFDQIIVNLLKRHIPWQERAWDAEASCWYTTEAHLETLQRLAIYFKDATLIERNVTLDLHTGKTIRQYNLFEDSDE